MIPIKTYNAISPKGLAVFPADAYTVGPDVEKPLAIIVRSQDLLKETIPESVLAIGRAGAGVNNIPVEAMSARGIVVFNAPGGNANAVKELVIGALIGANRNIVAAAHFVESLTTEGEALQKEIEGGKKKFSGSEIKGKSLGVIGLGAIGGEVANAACALGMEVLGHDPYATPEQLARLSPTIQVVTDKNDIFAADAITVHVPLLPATRGTVNAESFAHMKRGAILLNYSRDGIVDDAAALDALKNGTLAKYVTDFPSRELIGVPGVIATPHLGASTEDAEDNCAMMIARQVRDYLENGNVVNAVNVPKVALPSNGGARISIIHENVPDMLGKITHTLGERGINIESAANGAKGGLAYTLMNVGNKPEEGVLVALRAIPHVIRVRAL
ncbi:3-phosphoglycerate dehydrogenase [Candidatus Kaiserbacteria bacterium]|nr:3-phosphoglycerate dehydrogenase [Candidatus Kaiserbacteria bacterium]